MYGKTTGSLEVKLRYNGKHLSKFYKHGDKGNFWHTAAVTFNYPLAGYQVEIIATVGQSGFSDIAIDDVYLDSGKCSCQDQYVKCVKWARKGECQKNKKWMSDHCQRSCKICNDQTSVTTPNKKCIDTNKVQCPLWAKNGECSKNKAWMLKNCSKSCKICQGAPCTDKNTSCKAWAKLGECKKNPAYMKLKCKKSCGLCQ
ncbi:putative tyrosinase-like protein tyr-3 [Exaiptasia diaphana]|uniref:Uncharacterized protein n=1 Tax=Exaiptasia diaphana TaxID=2652724 RepID=A0A913YWP0_EXADI|nr:putative tyrosinase-like protein tyr-3 [Exaiptasia diaphana]